MKVFSAIAYFVYLILGITAAYKGDWVVALFFAIVFASENISISIDHWPRLNKKVKIPKGGD